jgi:periplasmic protein TonB
MPAIVRLPQPVAALDPKRIAATSLAIAVHGVVLLMLLMPTQVADPPKADDTTMEVIPVPRRIVEVKPPPLPTRPRPVTQTSPPVRQPVPVQVINNDPSPVDPVVDEVTLEEPPGEVLQVDPQPTFAQIQADVAPPPPYPAQALRMRQAGRVLLRVRVDEQGRAAEVAIESSSGFRALDEAAMKVVLKRWHFVPATQDGRAIQAWALVPIVFELAR